MPETDELIAKLRVVLVRPTHPGNIGAVARAMGNMGLRELYLVSPLEFPSPVATARASGADSILETAQVVADVDEALADCAYVVGTTARWRAIQWPVSTPRQAMPNVARKLHEEKVALIFGPERSGLANDDVDRCHELVRIPVSEAYPSLNLASAVLVLAYELRETLQNDAQLQIREVVSEPKLSRSPLASGAQLRGFYEHLEQVLHRIEFLKAKPPVKLMRKIVRIYNRSHLSSEEINILRGILTTIEHRLDEAGAPETRTESADLDDNGSGPSGEGG